MSLFGGVIPITGISFLMFCVFAILFAGYALGRITIKGVSLGDAGVFVVALIFGALFFGPLEAQLVTEGVNYAEKALEIIENLGLILFVTSVGFIAGPKFFGNMKKNFKSYVLLGLVIILAGGISAVACIYTGRAIGFGSSIESSEGFTAMIVGLLSGSLTSTPAFSAAKATVAEEYTSLVSVGHGIAYIFGVIGVVLFVQLIPKLTKADMNAERAKISVSDDGSEVKKKSFAGKLLDLDHYGFAVFSVAAVLGTFVGKIKIPLSTAGLGGTCFSFTTTGGCLLVALIFGHFGRIGKLNIMPQQQTLKLFRELGLVLFLVGAGIPGGADFVANFDIMYFVYGIIMTLFPMIVGYIFAKYVLKLSLLNSLGSITGGMTSTPALGTLINVAGTEDVAAAYAATYPIALISVVLVSQFLIILF
ncbi:MAG: permease [Clostridia bacterium]|nr:permease [Clostridia bacterium]